VQSTREHLEEALVVEGIDEVALWIGYWDSRHVAQVTTSLWCSISPRRNRSARVAERRAESAAGHRVVRSSRHPPYT
jgi:hypothetical protein